jgi:hypothetical protein
VQKIHNFSTMERRHQKLLIEKANELASGISKNLGDMLAELVAGGVISFKYASRVSDES